MNAENRDHRAEAAAADRANPDRWPRFVEAISTAIANLRDGEQFIAFTEVSTVVPKNSRAYYHDRLLLERPDLAQFIRRRAPAKPRKRILPPAAAGEPLQPWIIATNLSDEARVLIRLAVEAEEAAATGNEGYFLRARQILERVQQEIETMTQIIEDPTRRREIASR